MDTTTFEDQLNLAPIIQRYAGIDQCPALDIRYKGDEESCTIEVDANGNILSKIGDLSSEAADANFKVGSTNGTIDVSELSSDDYGTLVDFINGLDDYEAILHSVPRSYSVDGLGGDAASGTLLTASATQAKTTAGYRLYLDSSKLIKSLDFTGSSVNYYVMPLAIGREWLQTGTLDSRRPKPEAEMASQALNLLHQCSLTAAGGGTEYFAILAEDPDGNERWLHFPEAYSSTPKTWPSLAGLRQQAELGERLIVMAIATAAHSSGGVEINGQALDLGATPPYDYDA